MDTDVCMGNCGLLWSMSPSKSSPASLVSLLRLEELGSTEGDGLLLECPAPDWRFLAIAALCALVGFLLRLR